MGWVVVMWCIEEEYSCCFSIIHGELSLFKTENHPGELRYEPIMVTVVPSYSPRDDVLLTHAMLRWVRMSWPPSKHAENLVAWTSLHQVTRLREMGVAWVRE